MRPFLIAAAFVAALPAHAGDVTVFAAASLKTALDLIAADFTTKTGDRVAISYAGSGQLARQIIAGAPADLFISANVAWMDEVQDAGLVADGARKDLLGNRLVLIAPARKDGAPPDEIGPDTDLQGLLEGGKLAMALVNADLAEVGTDLSAHIVGVERDVKIIAPSPYDPAGAVMRA